MSTTAKAQVPEHIKELVSFLNDRNPQVREQAVELVLGMCGTPEGHAQLVHTEATIYLCRMLGDSNEKIAQNAVQALINLSEDPHFVPKMLKGNVISRLLDMILENPNLSASTLQYCIQLLSNVSIDPEGAKKVLNLDEPTLKGYYLTKLVTLFLKQFEVTDSDKYGWVANILTNVTQLKEGRDMLMEPKRGIVKAVLPYIEYQHSPVRKRGVLAMLRNCLFEKDHHGQFLDPELDFLSFLLMPIRGNEVFSEEKDTVGMPRRLLNVSQQKIRDPDIETRRMVVDCLILLTSTKQGRQYLKDNKAFPIVREYDKNEEDEELSMTIYKLVHVLLLDDPEDEPSSSDQPLAIEPSPAQKQHTASSSTSSTSTPAPAPVPEPKIVELPDEPLPAAKPAAAPAASKPTVVEAKKIDVDEAGEPIEEL
eukprot:TRINITY_DN10285_c0_g1_i1.p1 TRINITY_DN10285_c0_g1~~TRINITY_DN10285_c0_g1_i1.p1  ORF type:complete len:423 (+),score=100.99 TRINITY_DN10285_c0_g1_i1:64-1332(+)